MTVNRWVRVIAGLFVVISLLLGVENSPMFISKYWLWFTAFVGVNLFQSGFTKLCPLEMLLKRFGARAG